MASAQWAPFSTVPRDGRHVLLVMPKTFHSRVVVGYFSIQRDGKPYGVIDGDFFYNRPTPLYWMDLPEPPPEAE